MWAASKTGVFHLGSNNAWVLHFEIYASHMKIRLAYTKSYYVKLLYQSIFLYMLQLNMCDRYVSIHMTHQLHNFIISGVNVGGIFID